MNRVVFVEAVTAETAEAIVKAALDFLHPRNAAKFEKEPGHDHLCAFLQFGPDEPRGSDQPTSGGDR